MSFAVADYASVAADTLRNAQALIFDVDGTIAETEELHRHAFNEAFAAAGLDWNWGRQVYKRLLQVTGGKERISAFDLMRGQGHETLSSSQIRSLHEHKTSRYAELVRNGGCAFRPGVAELLERATRTGQRLAIATTTSRGNVDALLASLLQDRGLDLFEVIVAGDEVAYKKPAPDVYLAALGSLHLRPEVCVAIEDSANGLRSATLAGVPVIITKSLYFGDDSFDGALAVVDDLDRFF